MELINLFLPIAIATITAVLGYVFGKKVREAEINFKKAQTENQESETAETLSKSAKLQLETYINLVVIPLKDRLNEIAYDLKGTKESLKQTNDELLKARAENSIIREELFDMKVNFKQTGDSLDYLISEVKESYPEQVSLALKIRKGEKITKPLGKLSRQ